ncbi:metal ABC transporter ATP-binding protein [Thermicanus aegyptius]|uniref:metal ABC transporter ATP-binding protein n=1 Tax=Thermicanus aegyptius TaxID=94009 RepID=UPI000348C42F|nr:metal ABC transporter ATP-binding protein [Thermicanus aegyptius]
MDPILEIKDLFYRYDENEVLKGVSLSLKKGEMLGLVGPNGSGKSTLLKVILGFLPLQRGKVLWYGTELSRFRHWERIGYVSQKANSFNTGFPATVEEVVGLGRVGRIGLFKRPGKADREKVREALATVGMEPYLKRNIGRLSGGQQQRVFIAKALVQDPEVLILDEPTVGVDAHSEEVFYSLLKRLNQERGISLLLVSHDLGVVSEQMDTVACINHELFYHGPAEGFKERKEEVLLSAYGNDMRVLQHHH